MLFLARLNFKDSKLYWAYKHLSASQEIIDGFYNLFAADICERVTDDVWFVCTREVTGIEYSQARLKRTHQETESVRYVRFLLYLDTKCMYTKILFAIATISSKLGSL